MMVHHRDTEGRWMSSFGTDEWMSRMKKTGDEKPMVDDVLERNKNLNRGFRKLRLWREAIDLYAFEKKCLDSLKSISFKIKDQVLEFDPQITQICTD